MIRHNRCASARILLLLPRLEKLKGYRYRPAHSVLQLGEALQPLLQCLFRPEEVDHPSATPVECDGRHRIDAHQLTLVEDGVNAGCTLRRGGVDHYFFVRILAADQQQKVYRSVGVEPPPVCKRDCVKDEVQPRLPLYVALSDAIGGSPG